MNQKIMYISGIITLSAGIYFVNLTEDPIKATTTGNNRDHQTEIIKYLIADWSIHMHSTSIPHAMEALDIPENDELRITLRDYFANEKEKQNNIKYYGPNNYLLANTEKRIAKYLVNTFESTEKLPTLSEISDYIGITDSEAERRLDFLADAGLLDPRPNIQNNSQKEIEYKFVEKYNRFSGALKYNFHTISVESGDKFDVW